MRAIEEIKQNTCPSQFVFSICSIQINQSDLEFTAACGCVHWLGLRFRRENVNKNF